MKDRRHFRRFALSRPVGLVGADGQRAEAVTSEISLAGAGLLLDRRAVVALAQGGSILTAGDRVQLRLPLPATGPRLDAFVIDGQVRLVRRLSQAQYVAVVLFTDGDDASRSALSALVDEARGTPSH